MYGDVRRQWCISYLRYTIVIVKWSEWSEWGTEAQLGGRQQRLWCGGSLLQFSLDEIVK